MHGRDRAGVGDDRRAWVRPVRALFLAIGLLLAATPAWAQQVTSGVCNGVTVPAWVTSARPTAANDGTVGYNLTAGYCEVSSLGIWSIQAVAGAARSIKEFGAKCDGVTNDDVAFTAAFTSAAVSKTILIPAGANCLVSGNVRFHPPSGVTVNLIGQGIGVSKITIGSYVGPTFTPAIFSATPQQLFDEPNTTGWTARDLTIDVANATSLSANTAFSMSIFHCGLCTRTRFENLEFLNANPGMAMIALDGVTTCWIKNSYSQQTASHSNGKGIWIGSSAGTPSGCVIDGNTLVGTDILLDGFGHRVTNNDISGWGYGSGVGVGISIANLAVNRDNFLGTNYIHDSMVGQDTSLAYASGIENWAQRTTIFGNTLCRNSGTGLGSGGLNGDVTGNTLCGNGTGGVLRAGIGGSASGAASPAGTIYTGNHSYDDGSGNQLFGYQDNNNALGAQTFNGNDFTGNVTGNYSINASNAPTTFYIPSLEQFFVLAAAVSNGADTTADVVNTTTIPALKMGADGDWMHIIAGGSFGATTDSKTVQIKFGGALLYSVNSVVAAQSSWSADIWVHRKSATTQDWTTVGGLLNNGNSNGSNTNTMALVLTSPNDIVVTCQNATTATAGSVKLETMRVEIYHQTKS